MKSDRIIEINEEKIKDHLGEFVKGTVEETLNAMLDAEADAICNAQKYEHTPERKDTRAGSYRRKLQTKAGELNLKVPKLRTLPFDTAIIDRYRRREISVEESLVEMYCPVSLSVIASFFPAKSTNSLSPALCSMCMESSWDSSRVWK